MRLLSVRSRWDGDAEDKLKLHCCSSMYPCTRLLLQCHAFFRHSAAAEIDTFMFLRCSNGGRVQVTATSHVHLTEKINELCD